MKPSGKIYLVDTNVILRFLMGDHEVFSPKAETFMEKIQKGRIKAEVITPVIIECVYVMEKFYKIPRNEISDTLTGILTFSGIINPDKRVLFIALIEYGNTKIDIVDCLLAAFSNTEKVIVSFDKDFHRLNCTYEQL